MRTSIWQRGNEFLGSSIHSVRPLGVPGRRDVRLSSLEPFRGLSCHSFPSFVCPFSLSGYLDFLLSMVGVKVFAWL